MKRLRVTKIFKELKFGEGWGKLKAKKGFPKLSLTNYLRPTFIFIGYSALREKLNYIFKESFC